MIKIQNLNLDYGSEDSLIFKRVYLEFATGEFSLIVGPTGSGKSSLLKVVNRLIPNFDAGRLDVSLLIQGSQVNNKKTQELASTIGYVNQQPEGYFVADTVQEELAFGMEQLGYSREEMLERIQQVSGALGLEDLLNSPITELSSGQMQKVAIGAALAAGQRILLLDEPTSSLDDESALTLITKLRDLSNNLGVTILLAEHRFERLMSSVDSLVVLKGDGSAQKLPPSIDSIEKALPGWMNYPVSAGGPVSGEIVAEVHNLCVKYPTSKVLALQNISLQIRQHEIVAVQGTNGSGKTSLLMAIAGLLEATEGSVETSASIAVVPHTASDLLFLSSIALELKESDRAANAPANTTANIFKSLIGRLNPALHPRELSSGQQLALVLAIQLTSGSQLLLLDEPTRGLDHEAKKSLAKQIDLLRRNGKSVILATHDKDFSKMIADRTVFLHDGHQLENIGGN